MANITVNMESLSEEEREQLVALITKANEPQKMCNEVFWIINEYGKVCHVYADLPEDNAYFSIGNCFRTKEEAEFAVEQLKVIHELKTFAKKKKKHCDGYSLYYDNIRVRASYFSSHYYSAELYFESIETAKKAIKTIGEERLKKYYFCIED